MTLECVEIYKLLLVHVSKSFIDFQIRMTSHLGTGYQSLIEAYVTFVCYQTQGHITYKGLL